MATQSITGISSGLDTASIIEALMNVERSSYNKTSEKVEAEKLKLQAYQSVNSMLSSLKTSVNNLASSSLWNSKTTSSTNESSLKATANQYAVEGSYSLRVAQLATSAQYLSSGFSSQTSKVISSGSSTTSGTLTLESSQARVDTSAKLEALNGGNGIYRGSIRITDASGASSIVDVSGCETVDQVVTAINNAAGVQVQASIRYSDDGGSGDRLEIVDTSGGSGTMKIQNVGQGTTATDLGIAGASTVVNGAATITGSSIHYLSNNTAVSSLRDGLGIEDGMMCVSISGASGEVDVIVDLSDMQTVGDILNAVNSALQDAASGDEAIANLIGDLKLTINEDKNGLTFTGAQAGNVYTVNKAYNTDENGNILNYQPETVSQLGLYGMYTVAADGDSFGGSRLIGDLSSPLLSNLSGVNQTGIGSASSVPLVSTGVLNRDTTLVSMNGGAGVLGATNSFTIRIYEGGGDYDFRSLTDLIDADALAAMATDSTATLGDLVDLVNAGFADSGIAALQDARLEIDETGMGVYLTGLSSAHDYEIEGSLAISLGLVHIDGGYASYGYGNYLDGENADDPAIVDLYSYENIGENGNMIFESTTLSALWSNGAAVAATDLDAWLAEGMTMTIGSGAGAVDIAIDLSGLTGDSTVQDLMNAIDSAVGTATAGTGVAAPYLYIAFDGTGLNWRNVDVGEDFEVSGSFADAFGFSKDYTGQNFQDITTTVQKNLNPVTTGSSTPVDLEGTQLLSSLNGGAGLDFNGTDLTVTLGDTTLTVTRDELVSALNGGNYGSATVDEYLDVLNDLFNQKIAESSLDENTVGIAFGINDAKTGITITDVTGLADGTAVSIGGSLATTANCGFGSSTGTTGADFAMSGDRDIRGASITEVEVAGLGYIVMDIGGQSVTLDASGLSQESTLAELIYSLNSQLAANGYGDMKFCVSDSGSGIAFSNDSGKAVTFKYDEVSSLASDLGLVGTASEKTDTVVSASSHLNAASLNRNYIDRSTKLSSLNHGEGFDAGTITITDAQGYSGTISLSGCETLGDVIDAINGTFVNVKAAINDAGDGLVLYQTNIDTNEDGSASKGNISVTSTDGSNTAKYLGIAGTGSGGEDGYSSLNGSMKTVIEIGANDTLTDVMNRIASADSSYKTSIINDGTGTNSYRLSITSAYTGAAYDFIIDTDISSLSMQQVAKGQDSMVLYGDPDAGMSPIALKSSTNSNNQAILGLTLELNATSDTYTTVKVTTDTEKVVEELQNLVQCYNDLSDLITYLDSYDDSTDTKGILFGDSTIRNLMDMIDDMFYQVFNPDNLSYSDISGSDSKKTWTWFDLGISFSSNNSNSDGESGYWYSRMELDLDTLNDMVTNNWDVLKEMLSGTRNASDSTASANVAASAHFNYVYDRDENGNIIYPDNQDDPNRAINNDKSASTFGTTNGFTANKTIDEGENQYTIYFQQATTLDRVSIYHPSSAEYPASEYALKDFTVEYLDAATGKWVTLRDVTGNSSSSTILGFGSPTSVSAIRITASSTNAEDGKFRLLDVQCQTATGLAGTLSQTVNSLTDVVDGYFTQANATVEDKIADLQEQMEKMNERLDKKEQSLWNKYNAMEVALSQLNSQSSYLTTMFSSLSSSAS